MADDMIKDGADEAGKTADTNADAAAAGADQARDAGAQAQGAFRDHVVEPAKRAGEAMRESGQKMAQGGSTIGLKMIDQAEQNARQAFTAMRDAAAAKDLTQVMKIQGDYLREQSTRSMTQAREIGELIVQFGRDAVAPLKGDKG